MNRKIALAAFLAAATILGACTGSDKKTGNGASSEMMRDTTSFTTIQWIDSTTQDMGRVSEGARVEITWRFRNSGNKPLVIEKAEPGCGCTVADKPEAPIAPGGEGRIRAVFNSADRAGLQEKNIAVQANTTPSTLHNLHFSIDVTPQ